MLNWNNLDTLASYQELEKAERINLAEVMSRENGAERVKTYSTPIVDGLTFNYAAKAVDDNVLARIRAVHRCDDVAEAESGLDRPVEILLEVVL